jgi:hypothetical protein
MHSHIYENIIPKLIKINLIKPSKSLKPISVEKQDIKIIIGREMLIK